MKFLKLLSLLVFINWASITIAQEEVNIWPKTVNEAVTIIKNQWLSDEDRLMLLQQPKNHVLSTLHHGFGTGIRNNFGLWKGNDQLMKSCDQSHPDECSSVIIQKLWESIRKDADQEFVKKLDCQFMIAENVKIEIDGFYKYKIGSVIKNIQKQVNEKTPKLQSKKMSGCELKLPIRIKGDPDLSCWTRAEFSIEGSHPVSLDRLLGWIGFRNSFKYQHNPPYLDFIFYKKCSWPEPPKHFWPKDAINN
jgi:hypothetical protein